jgi:hypothetical protein
LWETILAAFQTADEEIDESNNIIDEILRLARGLAEGNILDGIMAIGTTLGLMGAVATGNLDAVLESTDPIVASLLVGFILIGDAIAEAFSFKIEELIELQKVMAQVQENMILEQIEERAAEAPVPEPEPTPAPPAPPTPPRPPAPRPTPVPHVRPTPTVEPKVEPKPPPKKEAA